MAMGAWWLCMVIAVLSLVVPVWGQDCNTDLTKLNAAFQTANLQCKTYTAGPSNQFYIWALKDNATQVTSMVVAVPLTTGNWAGLGFSADGDMIGSTALIAKLDSTGGANATVYTLKDKSSSDVVPGNGLSFVGGSAAGAQYDSSSNYVYMYYQVDLAKSTPANPSFLLMAYGVLNNDGSLQQHTIASPPSISAEFVTGVTSGESAVSKLNKKTKIHGSLNILGWGLLLPIGAMVARYARCFDPCWFYTHIVFQITGFACIIAGIATGVELAKDLQPVQLNTHRGLGIFIFVLAILQVLAVVVRPKKDAKVRKYWNWYHHGVGRVALGIAVANIFIGLHMSHADKHDFRVGYVSILCIELGASAILEILLWLRWNKHRSSQGTSPTVDQPFHFGGNV